MTRSMSGAAGAFALGAALLVGCTKSESTPAPTLTDPPSKGPKSMTFGFEKGKPKPPAKDGKEVFQTSGCVNCHSVGDTGAKKGKGPDLSHVAADATHTRDWLMAYVKDSKATNPESKMPRFDRKISTEDFEMLGDYLAGLK